MGWANCGTDSHGRPIGYAHAATCDAPGCTESIDRGLAYACGGMHGDNDPEGSCEGYFCEAHRLFDLPGDANAFVCQSCWERTRPRVVVDAYSSSANDDRRTNLDRRSGDRYKSAFA